MSWIDGVTLSFRWSLSDELGGTHHFWGFRRKGGEATGDGPRLVD